MKTINLIIIIIFITSFMNAQNNDNIIGTYSLGSSSPEGGSHLIVLENGIYAIAYFGGVQTGKWELTEDAIYRFLPNIKESKFELFGRHNKDLKDHTKIFFTGFEQSETFIQLRTINEEDYRMQRVFNTDANCFDFPYVHTFKAAANSISFMFKNYGDGRSPIITFKNPEGYNDFIANYIEINVYEVQPFYATFKANKLYFEENDYSERKPFDKDDEDIEFIKILVDKEMNRDTIYLNPSYNIFGGLDSEVAQDIHERHIFNKQKNAFIDPKRYTEGAEHVISDHSYENMSIIYAFNALKEFSKASAKFEIDEKSLFKVNCD